MSQGSTDTVTNMVTETVSHVSNIKKLENFESIKNYRWDMLNNFCFHVYAQMLMFMGENDNGYFLTTTPSPVSEAIIELVPS